VLVGIAAVLVRYFRDIRAARQRVDSLGSQVVETPCGPIEYVRKGEGYPLLAVHGAMVGDGHCRHAELLDAFHQLFDVAEAVKQGIFRMQMQVNKGHVGG
jgi:hypothetical protein